MQDRFYRRRNGQTRGARTAWTFRSASIHGWLAEKEKSCGLKQCGMSGRRAKPPPPSAVLLAGDRQTNEPTNRQTKGYRHRVKPSILLNPLDSKNNYSATSINTKLVHWPLVGGCYICYSKEGPERTAAPPCPLLAIPNVTAHPSTASVPITVFLYDGLLLCCFNVSIKGLIITDNLYSPYWAETQKYIRQQNNRETEWNEHFTYRNLGRY